MKVISFLGTAAYKSTTYVWGEEEHTTQFFPAAVARFIKPEKLLICATPTVQRHENLNQLGQQLDQQAVVWEVVPIPEGHSESDLWLIFDVLTAAVTEGEEVTFDVTHSFRSLPILALLAVAYLKTAKRVKVHRVLYGAFEARDEQTNRSPVFDLTPFVSLLDWLTATDQFVQTGDARRLAKLLNPTGQVKGATAMAAQSLSEVSLAAFLCQPFALMSKAQTLDSYLHDAEQELAQQARPFGVVRDQITSSFGIFGADFQHDAQGGLRAQLRMIEWYYKNNQLIQAITLSREWLIDAVTYRLGKPIDLDLSNRKIMEEAVSGLSRVGQERRDENGEKYTVSPSSLNEYGRVIYNTWPEREILCDIWNHLQPTRNALDHAEHQKGAMALAKVHGKALQTLPLIRNLARQWSLL